MSHAQYDPTPKAPPPWAQSAPAQGPGIARLLPVLGVVLGLLGLGMGAAAWFRATPAITAEAPAFSDQQVVDASAALCGAYTNGVRSMRVVAARIIDNPADTLPVAVNSRLAEVAVGNYFINALAANPAASPELQEPLLQLARAYQDVALIQLANGTPSDYKSEKAIVNEAVARLDRLCQ